MEAAALAASSCSISPSAVLSPDRSGGRRRWQKQHRQRVSVTPIFTVAARPQSISFSNGSRRAERIRWRRASGSWDEIEGGKEEEEEEVVAGEESAEVVERALGMDGSIPSSADELVRRVSSRAYDMRRHLKQTIDSSGYDVLESNPWREHPKPVYVLTQGENQICTMKTRRSRSEVERELGLLFSNKGGKRGSSNNKMSSSPASKQVSATTGTKFHMFVEDIREGILVFEDEQDAERYCDLLQGGKGCAGIAQVEASSVFDICHKMRALAVLFRRGMDLPMPETLELNLKARKRSLEDQ